MGKKCQNSDKMSYGFNKNDIMLMPLLYIYKKPIILSLFKIDTLKAHSIVWNDFWHIKTL